MSAPTSTALRLPAPKDLRDLLRDLLGREVEVVEDPATESTLAPRASVGVYQDDRRNDVAVVTTDLPLSAYLAAALALTPADAAQDAVKNGSLTEGYVENLHEVLNVVGTLFNQDRTRPTRLTAMYAPGQPVPTQTATRAATGRRLDLAVTVPGYGAGHLAVAL